MTTEEANQSKSDALKRKRSEAADELAILQNRVKKLQQELIYLDMKVKCFENEAREHQP